MNQIGARFALLAALAAGSAGLGCAPRTPPSKAGPPSPDPLADNPAEPDAAPAPRPDVLGPLAAPIPEVPASCPAVAPPTAPRACPDVVERLGDVLSLSGPGRDTELAALEACQELPYGIIRAVRAELGPVECADGLVAPLLDDPLSDDERLSAPLRETLVALGLGARLRRLASSPPAVPGAHDRDALGLYFKDQLFPWITEQATAIQALATQGAQLKGYARGVVAIEAGMADMRFVEIARAVPIPTDIAADAELNEAYYSSLDEALEPRKARGRDGALVGLLELSRAGIFHDARLDSARSLLSRVFGGSRVTALDLLMLPDAAPVRPKDTAERIAVAVPTPYVLALLGDREWDPSLVRAGLQRGLPSGVQLELSASADAESRYLGALGRFTSGCLYFKREDFQAADAALASLLGTGDLSAPLRQDASLLHALAVALSAGPADLISLFARGPRFADALGNLAELDALATNGSPYSGRAAYDAAYLRELVAEPGVAATWRDLSARYKRASASLTGPLKKQADERSKAAHATELAISKPKAH